MIKKVITTLCFILPSSVSRLLYRLCGYTVGRNSKLPFFSLIYGKKITIGNDVDIRPFVFIRVNELTLGNNTIISFWTQIIGDKDFSTKDNCFLGPHSIIHCDEDVQFGFYSGIGPRCIIYTHGSFLPVIQGYPANFDKVVIEDFVWIAMSVSILAGARIESNCIINPGVVVHSRIKGNSLVQIKHDTYTNMDVNRLCRYGRKSTQVYHERIIADFLTQANITFQHIPHDKVFRIKDSIYFSYDTENNIIHLSLSKNKKISYDLENYYVDNSNNRMHKAFIFFLRRRFGLTLRTRY